MTDVKRLLDEATPLPWQAGDIEPGAVLHDGRVRFRIVSVGNLRDNETHAALIVYAVNTLPDYEAAVDALAKLMAESGFRDDGSVYWNFTSPDQAAWTQARAVLRRLRGES